MKPRIDMPGLMATPLSADRRLVPIAPLGSTPLRVVRHGTEYRGAAVPASPVARGQR